MLFIALGVGACSDDDEGTKLPAATQGDGSDGKYVELMCGGWKTFSASVQEIIRGATQGGQSQPNQAQTEKLVAKPTAELAAALAAIKPPEDVRAWHEANANQLLSVSKAYEAGSEPPTQAAGAQLSAAASQRLTKLAAENADCRQAGSSPFGGS
jgi:Ser/Thr protein kinase RdoA (MazF antagonist)